MPNQGIAEVEKAFLALGDLQFRQETSGVIS
jgi:hypothetical protein